MSLPSPTSNARPPQPQPQPHPEPHPRPTRQPRQPVSPAATSPSGPVADALRASAFPFSLTRSIQPNPSSTSVVPSVAEGRPIPLDDDTAEHRTTALRELNHHYPSRHRYAKSTGAQSSTHSEPVIVRSYYAAPSPPTRPAAVSSRASRRARCGGGAAPSPGSSAGRSASVNAPCGLPFSGKLVAPGRGGGGGGRLSAMVLARGKRPVDGRAEEEEARLPPVDAFTFKSFMANMEVQGGGGSTTAADINADLDRIAEICARSRYSLSNQYEVHFTPHGSGPLLSPSTSAPLGEAHGPTLQAVTSDDDERSAAASSRRRRRMARRNSRAIGTLETIMSSSRSSDEERSTNDASAEAAAVRGRASTRGDPATSPKPSSSSRSSEHGTPPPKRLIDDVSPDGQASIGLDVRPVVPPPPPKHPGLSVASGAITPVGVDSGAGILSRIHGWMAWRASPDSAQRGGLAAGSLRELLRTDRGRK